MAHKYSGVELAAWEVFVQLVGNGRCATEADAAAEAFRAVDIFDIHCKQRRESKESKRAEEQKTQASDSKPPERPPITHTQKPIKPTTVQDDLNDTFGKAK
jgi:hypothetical protein